MRSRSNNGLKWLAAGSLTANLLLIVGLLVRPASEPSKTKDTGSDAVAHPLATGLVTNTLITVRHVAPATPRFDWSLVESEDYEVYLANLRRLELPAWLVRELVLGELQQHYRMRELELPGDGPAYWLTYREARALRRQRAEARWALRQEERDVMRRLAGVYRHEDAASVLTEGRFALMLGALTADQAMEAVSELAFVKERADFLKEYHNGLFSRADEEHLRDTYESARAEVASRISSALFEEFYLRLQIFLGGWADDFSLPGIQLTGAQLRELVRIRSGLIDPLRWELTEADKPEGAARNQLNREVQTALARVLGDDVAGQYARSQDPAFRAVHQLTEHHELPVERAIAVYDIRQATIDEVRSLISSAEIDEFEKWEMRQFIQQEAERAVQVTLGPEAWEDYRANDGRWMDRIGGPPPEANAGGGR